MRACIVGELRFAAELRESEALRDELQDFRRHVTTAGRATYQARAGGMTISCSRSPSLCGGPTERRRHRLLVGAVRGLC